MDQLESTVTLVQDVLGSDALGAYLHGSSVLGGLRPASDLDVLVIARHSLDQGRRRALVAGLLERSDISDTLRPVELSVVVRAEVRPWRYPPVCDFMYGEWLRAEFVAGAVPQPAPMPDLALLVSTVLAGDRPLFGPPPAHLLDPVPQADLRRASLAGVPDLVAELDEDTRNVVLTLARVWAALATGEVRTKDAAADWAMPRLPPEHRDVLRHARELYLHHRYAEETWPEELRARVRPHVAAVLAEIERSS